jgi:hypothetical protein
MALSLVIEECETCFEAVQLRVGNMGEPGREAPSVFLLGVSATPLPSHSRLAHHLPSLDGKFQLPVLHGCMSLSEEGMK